MAEETPKEKYERLQRAIQSEILTAYPNPTRKDCPGDAVVKQVAERKEVATDEVWEHITHCSPCYAEFLAYKDAVRKRSSRSAQFFRHHLLAAACLLIAAAMVPLVWNGRDNDRRHDAELDLRHQLIFRGSGDSDQQLTRLNPPLTLRRGHLHLKIDLPKTWTPGRYDVAFSNRSAHQVVFATTGDAVLTGTSTILTIDARLDVTPGEYTMSLRRKDSGWTGYPVKVTDK